MELSELKTKIIESFTGSKGALEEVLQLVDDDKSIFPFNEYEHLICNLIEKGGLSYDQYEFTGDNLEQAIREAAGRN